MNIYQGYIFGKYERENKQFTIHRIRCQKMKIFIRHNVDLNKGEWMVS